MVELKRCPLCDSPNITIDDYDPYGIGATISDRWRRRILCLDCGVSIHRKTDEEAAEAWNTRKYSALVANVDLSAIDEEKLDKLFAQCVRRFAERLGGDQ